jgi:omega-6 fatty acid desaturase (delta-12 desaturase)
MTKMEHHFAPEPDKTTSTGRADEWLTADEVVQFGAANVQTAYAKYLTNFALYFSSLALALSDLGLVANIIGAILNGVSLAVFFIIGHDCVHAAFFKSRLANAFWGRIAYGLCWHSVTLWKVVHNINHHTRTNLKTVDDVWRPFSPEEFKNLPIWRRMLERAFRHPAGHLIYYQLDFLFPKLILPLNDQTRPHWKKHLPDSLLVLSLGAAVFWGIIAVGGLLDPQSSIMSRLIFGFVIPFILWNALTSFTIYIQHTHPNVHWFADEARWSFYRGQIESTTDVLIDLKAIPLYSEVLRHTAHHSYPKIPVYKLPEAQEKLVARYGAAVTQWRLGLRHFLDVHRRCKLYDYDAQRWTDFDGRPTSGSWFDRHRDDANPFRARIGAGAAGKDAATAA